MFQGTLKPINLLVGAGFVVIVLVAAYLTFQFEPTTDKLPITKVPADATLFIDNKEIKTTTISLKNGRYEIRAEKDGFASYTSTLIVNDYTTYVAVALTPESDEAKKWAEANEDAYLDFESKVGVDEAEAGKLFVEANPIVAKLPLNNYTYKVGYISDPGDASGKSIILTVTAYSGYRNAAISAIYDLGFDPAEYKIQFNDYTNPFSEEAGDE